MTLQTLYSLESANKALLEEVQTERELLVPLLKHYNNTGQKTQRIINMLTKVEAEIATFELEIKMIEDRIRYEIQRGWEITRERKNQK